MEFEPVTTRVGTQIERSAFWEPQIRLCPTMITIRLFA